MLNLEHENIVNCIGFGSGELILPNEEENEIKIK